MQLIRTVRTRERSIIREFTWHLLIPLIFITFVFSWFPFREVFGNTDEGINVIKASLLSEDYQLYQEIWSDQPPVLTYLLLFTFQLLGFKVNIGRVLVLALSGILVWAYVQFMRIAWGEKHALAGTIALFLLPNFIPLSVSIMVGLPAISFGMVSVYLAALWHRNQKPIWLVLSAAVLSVSVMTKLFTGILAPIIVLMLVGHTLNNRRSESGEFNLKAALRPALIWGGVFSIVTLGFVALLIGPENINQLVLPHIEARDIDLIPKTGSNTLEANIGTSILTLVLSYSGAILSIQKRKWLAIYPILWSTTAYLFLFTHSPVWDHQILLVTIPASMLAGSAGADGFSRMISSRIMPKKWSLEMALQVSSIVIFAFLVITKSIELSHELKPLPSFSTPGLRPTSNEVQFLLQINEHADETEVFVTDLPLFAFRAGLPVPPELAVFSYKRLVTGNLSEELLVQIIEDQKPHQIFLGRFGFPGLENILREDYQVVRAHDSMRLYLRKPGE